MKFANAMLAAVFVVMALAIPTFVAVGLGIDGENYEIEMESGWAYESPTIDGIIDEGEYANATIIDIEFYPTSDHRNDKIYIYFMNDNDWLYIAVDLLPDNTSDEGDYCFIAFDEDNNDQYEQYAPDFEAWYVQYIIEVNSTLVPYSQAMKPWIYAAGFDTTENDEDVEHRIWEMKIPLDNFIHGELETGDEIGVMMYGYGTLAPEWDYPINVTEEDENDAENWAKLTLAVEPEVVVDDEGIRAGTYGMAFIGIGTVILLVLVVFYNETFVKWIGNGDYRLMFMAFGFVLLLLILGLTQWYYDWLGYLGII